MSEYRHTHARVLPHVWVSHESCHTCEWVMSHVTRVSESWVMSHVWVSHESCHTCEWVMSCIWGRHVVIGVSNVTHTNEYDMTHRWATSRAQMRWTCFWGLGCRGWLLLFTGLGCGMTSTLVLLLSLACVGIYVWKCTHVYICLWVHTYLICIYIHTCKYTHIKTMK